MILRSKPDEAGARLFSGMIIASAGYLPLIFGKGIEKALEKLFMRKHNLFSHEHVTVYEHENEPAAMLLAYDYRAKQKEDLHTGWLLARYLHISMFRNWESLMRLNNTVGKLNKGEYYISNIAVFEGFRRRGFANDLLLNAEKDAKMLMAAKMVLDVEEDNHAAIALYKKLGYAERQKFQLKINRSNTIRLIRMKKPLT